MARGRPSTDDRGAYLLLFAFAALALLAMGALVVDIGALQSTARSNQSLVDLAALSGGKRLGYGKYELACRDMVTFLRSNEPELVSLDPVSFCNQAGDQVSQTVCNAGALAQATPSATVGRFTVELHFPVPDAEIDDGDYGSGRNDGLPCQRMRLLVTTDEPTFLAGVLGVDSLVSTASATVRPKSRMVSQVPALWLLDPTGCVALDVSGGSQVTVGATEPDVLPGVITVESDASACSSNQVTMSASGSGTWVRAVPTGTDEQDGVINLNAMPLGGSACGAKACDPADVAGGRITPQPVYGERPTRAPVDWTYDCKPAYPNYHGVVVPGCPDTLSRPAYLTLLRGQLGTTGSGQPAGFTSWRGMGYSCNPSGTIAVSGNWWIDCPSGLRIQNGTTVSFLGGNVVTEGGIDISNGGTFRFNSANATPHLARACTPPEVSTPCATSSSAEAAVLWMRSGDLSATGGVIDISRTTVVADTGAVKVSSAIPSMTAPIEGPFSGLALWANGGGGHQISGGAGVELSGTFFTPEAAPFKLTGGGNWGQQKAQFITYRLAVSGGGVLTMAPEPNSVISLPPVAGTLIR